jgi:HK97 family phage prohead protease
MKEIRERRILNDPVEIRAAEDGSGEYIEGYALKFNRWSETIWDYFREIIDPGALDNADMSDVVATFNHSEDYPLARNSVQNDPGKLELIVDNIGLKYRFKPTDTSYANDLKANLRAGVVSKSSFAFDIDYMDDEAEKWEYNETDQIWERRIMKFNHIYDVSPVTRPAYSDTEAVVGARSLEKVKSLEELRKKPSKEAREKLLLELDLMRIR